MFKKTDLGTTGTPLVRIEEYSGVGYSSPLYIKREELCAPEWNYGCTDMRKLEFLLVDLARKAVTDVIMYSRYGSHFTRQAAMVLSRFGITVHCLFSEEFSPIYTHNLSLLHLAGAETYGTQPHGEIAELIERLTSTGRNVSVVDISGHRSVAAMGGFALFDEIKLDLKTKFNLEDAIIYVGVDSGSTMAGMLAASVYAKKEADHTISIIGVPMFDNADTYADARSRVLENYDRLNSLAEEVSADFSIPELSPDGIVFSDDSLTRGTVNAALVAAAKEFYNLSGIILDPIHGFHTVMSALTDSKNSLHGTRPIVFVNPALPIISYFQYNEESKT